MFIRMTIVSMRIVGIVYEFGRTIKWLNSELILFRMAIVVMIDSIMEE